MRNRTTRATVGGGRVAWPIGPARSWALAVEASPLVLVVVDAEDHVVLAANDAFRRLTGLTADRLSGLPLPDALPPASADVLRRLLARVRRSGAAVRQAEIEYPHPERGPRVLEATIWPLADADETPDALAVHLVDVTHDVEDRADQRRLAEDIHEVNERLIRAGIREQELAEQARHHSARIDALLRSLSGGVAVVEGGGRIAMMNRWAREVLCLPGPDGPVEPEQYGRLDLRYPDGPAVPLEEHPFVRALRGRRFTGVEYRLVYRDRTHVRLSFNGSAIPEDEVGGARLAIVVFQDVTELRRLEELRGDYLSLISHDLRAPLSAILGYAQLLEMHLRRKGENPSVEQARRIGIAAHRMNGMIAELVESTRLEAGALELNREPTDPAELLGGLVERIGTEQDRLRIDVDVAGRVPMLSLDRERIERAITNLVTNALKYSPSDAPVTVRIWQTNGDVAISVADRGPGIPPDLLPRLFQRFYRAERRAEVGGVGLGLYIARLIVEAHGGRIWAESEVGEGSTFRVSLPVR